MKKALIVLFTVFGTIFLNGIVQADLNDGLVAYYPFNGNANDESGNGNHGTVNGTTLTIDRYGNANRAYSFDGVDDFIKFPDSARFKPLMSSTLSFWLYPDPGLTKRYDLFDQRIGSGTPNSFNYGIYFNTPNTNSIHHVYPQYNNENTSYSVTNVNMIMGWNYFVFMKDTYENKMLLFVNGKKIHEMVIIDSDFEINGSLILGKHNQYNINHFKGFVDDIRIYNRALSEAEIQQLYQETSGNTGDLKVTIDPADALNAGARWRVDGGAWHDSGDTRKWLSAGLHTVEFKNIDGWGRPKSQQVLVLENQLTQISGGYTAADFQNAALSGMVTGQSHDGAALGVLADALVELPGVGSAATDGQGWFRFSGVLPGTYDVTVSKTGYYPVQTTVALGPGTSTNELFALTLQQVSSSPAAYDFYSSLGNHFVSGMPGDLDFETMIDWKGSPGSVRILVNGQWKTGAISDMGNGQARVKLSVPFPSDIPFCSELVIEITNGEGKVHTVNTGYHFYPLLGVIPWYQATFWWTPTKAGLSYPFEKSWDFDLPMPTDDIELEWSLGYDGKFNYDLLSATLSGSLTGSGGLGFTIPTPQPGFKILGEGSLNITGELAVSFMGCDPPAITPVWDMGFSGKTGIEAPAVLLLDAVVPGAGTTLGTIPKVKDIKLQLYQLYGGGLSGEYPDGLPGNCLFGAYETLGYITGGLEAQARIDFTKKVNAGVYVGGTGTFSVDTCPDLGINGFSGNVYAGAFAQIYAFSASKEIGARVAWDFTSGPENMATLMDAKGMEKSLETITWEPVTPGLLEWGAPNRLVPEQAAVLSVKSMDAKGATDVAAGEAEKVMENLTWSAGPTLLKEGTRDMILYTLYDTEKPWHQSSDIAALTREQDGDGAWTLNRITDDLAAEFSPAVHRLESGSVTAAWTRVYGDISEARGPEEIVPYFEIMAAFLDAGTGTWTEPLRLTDNSLTDRDPLPVSFGSRQGVMWVQNQGQAAPGNADFGDSLVFAAWNGTVWESPVTIWSGMKGIVGFSSVGDSAGECHVVFTVDEDGDPETTADLELYSVVTAGGVWQPAQQLTDNAVADTLPLLLSPDGLPLLVWRSGDTLMYSPMSLWQPAPVYPHDTPAGEAPSLAGAVYPGGGAIAYSVQGPEGVDIFAAFYDAGLDQWSLPRQLTHDPDAESALSVVFDGARIQVCFLKTQTLYETMTMELNGQMQTIDNVPQPGRTDLYVLDHELGYDLAVQPGSLVLDPVNPAPGSEAAITAIIENRGDLPARDVLVHLYDGTPESGGTLIGQHTIPGIIAGASMPVTMTWTLSGDMNPHHLVVAADPHLSVDDRDRSSNIASVWTVLPDPAVETSSAAAVSSDQAVIFSRIVNNGVIPTGRLTVGWFLDHAQGPQIGSAELDAMAPGAFREASLVWDHSGYLSDTGHVQVYTVVDGGGPDAEADASNNSAFAPVRGLAVADEDGDGVPDVEDHCPGTLPGEPVDIYGCSPSQYDTDGDGMDDDFEQRIVDADPSDAIHSIADVYPGDDFDGDGYSNIREFLSGSDPTDPWSLPACIADGSNTGSVDGRDAAGMAQALDTPECLTGVCMQSDLDQDGDVDDLDLLLMSEDFGRMDCF